MTFDYVRHHVDIAARELADARGKRVLVVGCNRGREVSLFLEAGAREAWGVDVMDEIGSEYPSPAARYVQTSAESMELDDELFDVVFCVATLEHVQALEAAYAEIARVTASEGFIYVVSAPLWNSREGHHKPDLFDVDSYPGIHLRFGADELKRMCASGEIRYPHTITDVDAHIDYMMSPAHMNQRHARDYVRACAELPHVAIERNDVDLEREAVLDLLPSDDRSELEAKGADELELRALTHTFIGWKDRRPADLRTAAADVPSWPRRAYRTLRQVRR